MKNENAKFEKSFKKFKVKIYPESRRLNEYGEHRFFHLITNFHIAQHTNSVLYWNAGVSVCKLLPLSLNQICNIETKQNKTKPMLSEIRFVRNESRNLNVT